MRICKVVSASICGMLVLASVALLARRSQAQPADSGSLAATYARGRLRVLIPYAATRAGAGSLTVEVLDPEDRMLGHIERRVDVSQGQGSWTQEFPLTKTLAIEDSVWHRLRYRFTYGSENAAALQGTYSISRILRRPVVHILGQQSYLSGAPAAVRLIVTGHDNETAVDSGAVRIELLNPSVAAKAINFIAAKKDAAGTWGTTQATIMALRALLLATEKGGAAAKGVLEVVLNGKSAATLTLTAENNDLLHQFAFKNIGSRSANVVEIRFAGEGRLAYQVAGRYFLPWNEQPAREALSIEVSYDRRHLAQDELVTATAIVRNNLANPANMVMVNLGIPPGFELLTEDLQEYHERCAGRKIWRLEKISLTGTKAILYFNSIAPGDGFPLTYRLRAKYPIRARTFAPRIYEYYDPEMSSLARPVQLEVHTR